MSRRQNLVGGRSEREEWITERTKRQASATLWTRLGPSPKPDRDGPVERRAQTAERPKRHAEPHNKKDTRATNKGRAGKGTSSPHKILAPRQNPSSSSLTGKFDELNNFVTAPKSFWGRDEVRSSEPSQPRTKHTGPQSQNLRQTGKQRAKRT